MRRAWLTLILVVGCGGKKAHLDKAGLDEVARVADAIPSVDPKDLPGPTRCSAARAICASRWTRSTMP